MTRRLTVSVEEAARMLGISRTFAYALVRREELPSVQLGRRLVIPVAALVRLLQSSGSDEDVIDLTDDDATSLLEPEALKS